MRPGRRRVRASFAAVAAVALLASGGAYAASCPQTSLADVEDEVMCPVCGVPLGLATEAPQAQRQREFIQREVQSCKSKDQIKTALVAEFGDRVLALPPDEGFNLVAYLVPAAVVASGAGAVGVIALRRKRTGAGATTATNGDGPSGDDLGDADAERLEEDLRRYEL